MKIPQDVNWSTLYAAAFASQLLLSQQGLQWPEQYYTQFAGLTDASNSMRTRNPTREQVKAATINWLKFFKSLLDNLENNDAKVGLLKTFDDLAAPYRKWL